MSKKNKNILRENAALREQEAHIDLVEALQRCKSGSTVNVKVGRLQKITPSMVAKEAGRSRSIIYATHTDILDQIDKANRRRTSSARDKRVAKLKADENLRGIIDILNQDKSNLAQENYRLHCENEELKNRLKRLEKKRSTD